MAARRISETVLRVTLGRRGGGDAFRHEDTRRCTPLVGLLLFSLRGDFSLFFFFSRRHSKHGSSNVHSLVRLHTALCKEQERWTLTNWLLSCQASDVARKCCLLKGSKCRFVMLSLVEGLNVQRLNAEAIAAGT